MFETLENNPTLRERVLGLTAIGAILIGGAAGVDTMLTGGWQIGGTEGAPVIYADTLPQYQDDVNRDWSTNPPQRVQLAAQDATLMVEPSQSNASLDGDGTVTPAVYALAAPAQQTTATAPQTSEEQNASDQRYEAIENDVRQANAALGSDSDSKDDTSAPSSNDQG